MHDSPENQGDPQRSFGPENTPYEAIGGETAVLALVTAFYDRMETEEAFAAIRKIHPDDLSTSRSKLHDFLSGWLGGPPLYQQKHGHPRLRMRHAEFAIGIEERDQWLDCMSMAMDEVGIHGSARDFLDARFAHVADFMRNR